MLEVLTTVSLKIQIFSDVTPCCLVTYFFEELAAYVFTVGEVQLTQHHNLEVFNLQIIKYVTENISS
jgi:hypothetical protein